jgi:hypothetical protein
LVERLLAGSRAHADRRKHEVGDALEYIQQLGIAGWMSAGALKWLSALADEKT